MPDKLHRAMFSTPSGLASGLYAIVDDAQCEANRLVEVARSLMAQGIPAVQLRLKQTTDDVALGVIRAVAQTPRIERQLLIVNDRVDLALMGGADGVHLGADDVPVSVARMILGAKSVIGATVRHAEGASAAHEAGADYVGLGPVFETTTKHVGHPPLGLDAVTEVVRQSSLPVVAIGGISLSTIGVVAATGVRAAAVAGHLWSGGDVISRARALHQAFLAHAP